MQHTERLEAILLNRAQLPFLIDMDGVCADLKGELVSRMYLQHGIILPDEELKSYHVSPEYEGVFEGILLTPGFFRSLPPYPLVREGINLLRDLGYDPVLCTKPFMGREMCKREKREWADEHIGQWIRIQFSGHKWDVPGSHLLEDDPVYAERRDATWHPIIRRHEYNMHTECPHIDGWQDLIAVLSRITSRDMVHGKAYKGSYNRHHDAQSIRYVAD
jgi:5'-nucleotidase